MNGTNDHLVRCCYLDYHILLGQNASSLQYLQKTGIKTCCLILLCILFLAHHMRMVKCACIF